MCEATLKREISQIAGEAARLEEALCECKEFFEHAIGASSCQCNQDYECVLHASKRIYEKIWGEALDEGAEDDR